MFDADFPSPEDILIMPITEVAYLILSKLPEKANHHLSNLFSTDSSQQLKDYVARLDPDSQENVMKALSTAWNWLNNENLIAPHPRNKGWHFVTRTGEKARDRATFDDYLKANLLKNRSLDSFLKDDVMPLFISGKYETAVFSSCKEIEIRVRDACSASTKKLGLELMRLAFKPDTGILTDKSVHESEQTAMLNLFQGAIGLFKNPTSHRNVDYNDPEEAAEIILFCDMLLKIVERRKAAISQQKETEPE